MIQARQNSNLNALKISYLEQLALNKSKLTVQAYSTDLRSFLQYIESKGVKKAVKVSSSHIISYLGTCKADNKSDATLNRYYMSIKSFFSWLRKSKHIEIDVALDVTKPKLEPTAPRVPTVQEVGAILSSPDTEDWDGIRDRAILELLYSSGLRASELCDLKLQDVRDAEVFVAKGKRSKGRTVPVNEAATYWVQQYIERCRGDEEGYLWQRNNGNRLSRQDLFDLVTKYARAAFVQGVSPHTLRHACATHLLNAGADLRLIQEVLGHSSIASTEKYTHLSSQRTQSMFKQYHPRRLEEDDQEEVE